MRTLPKYMNGNGPLVAEWNRMVDYVRGLELRVQTPLEIDRTPGGTILRLADRGIAAPVSVGRVVVLGSSVLEGPTDFDTLTYFALLVDEEQTVPALSGDPSLPVYRVCDMVRYGETFDDGQGGTTGWQVDPARPGTYGTAIRMPKIENGQFVEGETVTVVRLYDERVSVKGCTG